MTRPIFIHGLFRCGSTYFFDKLRSDGRYQCFYEPFHHVIGDLDAKNIDIWNHSGKTSKRMNHPLLDRPHFYEYLSCFESGRIKSFDKKLSYDRFYLKADDYFNPEKDYIDNLINSTPKGKIPVLQFNRSSFRLKHFVDNYPGCEHIYLLRSPRNQFKSYVASGQIFLIINLILASRLSRAEMELPFFVNFYEDKSIQREIAHYSFLSFTTGLRDHYKLFLYLWCWSLFYALESGCTIIDIDDISVEALQNKLHDKSMNGIDVSDFVSKKEDINFILDFCDAKIAEDCVFKHFLSEVPPQFEKNLDPYAYVNYRCVYQPVLRRNYYRQLLVSIGSRFYYHFKFRVYLKSKRRLVSYGIKIKSYHRKIAATVPIIFSNPRLLLRKTKNKISLCLRSFLVGR